MIAPVVLNQSNFTLPGAGVDERKILIAPTSVVSLPSFDRVVKLLAALSREVTLENGWARTRIILCRAPGGQRQFLVQRPLESSLDADFIATAAAMVGGLTYVGSERHYARYRDRRAPLGYDIIKLEGGTEPFVLYNPVASIALTIEREHKLADLVKSLPLVSAPVRPSRVIFLRGPSGLMSRVSEYLLRRRCQVELAQLSAQPEMREAFATTGATESILRAHKVSPALVADLARLPSVTAYCNALEEIDASTDTAQLCLVERGYAHPLRLWGVRRALAKSETIIRRGHPALSETLPAPLYFVAAESLLADAPATPAISRALVQSQTQTAPRLSLRPSTVPRVPRASFITRAQLPQLVRLLYLLPEAHLRRTKALALGNDLFVLAGGDHELPPLGTFYFAQAPDVLVPVGSELRPRLPPELMHVALRVAEGHFVVYLHGQEPLALAHEQLQPLSVQLIAQTQPELLTLPPVNAEPAAREVVNDRFPLWGSREVGP